MKTVRYYVVLALSDPEAPELAPEQLEQLGDTVQAALQHSTAGEALAEATGFNVDMHLLDAGQPGGDASKEYESK